MTNAMRRVLLGVASVGLLAQLPPALRSRNGAAPLILITVDTLRADRLECYGYTQIKTPHINRLATDGSLFSNAFAHVPLTLPSHWSILTGTYPTFHGVRHNAYAEPRRDTPSLAEALKSGGYASAAFVGSFVLDRRFGLARGFDYYFDNFSASRHEGVSPADVERRGDEVVKAFAGWLAHQTHSRFFAWIHLFDPHAPYDPPEPFRSLYSGPPYDGEVAFIDRLVGEIVSLLQSKYPNATIIFTADHGEALGEHGEETHGLFLYDASLHVPLIVKTGGTRKGSVIDSQVRSIDIAPTLLALAGLQRPGSMQGTNLVPLLRGGRSKAPSSSYSETYYPTYGFGWSELRSVRTEQFKYIDAPRPELYDLASDPKESRNLVASNGAAAARMKDLLFETVRLSSGGVPREAPLERKVDPATLER
ncbi:MAG TPA: sulfatase, partial [Polyangiaceae bacterium]